MKEHYSNRIKKEKVDVAGRKSKAWAKDGSEVGEGTSGVFRWLVNHIAFFDRVDVSLLADGGFDGKAFESGWAALESSDLVTLGDDVPILGPKSMYARKLMVRHCNGNPIDVMHGRTKNFRNVPILRLRSRSVTHPITEAQVEQTVRFSSLVSGLRAQVAEVEVTFDLAAPFNVVAKSACSRARLSKVLYSPEDGRRTLYLGSQRCPSQVRIYEKCRGVVRLEFILRRPFLRYHGFASLYDLNRLRSFNLWDWIWFVDCRRSAEDLLRSKWEIREESWRAVNLRRWLNESHVRWRLEGLYRSLAVEKSLREEVFRTAPIERRLRQMQRRLVW